MNDKLSDMNDEFIIHEVMEGSELELEEIMDKYGIDELQAVWDNDPPILSNEPDVGSKNHEWIRIDESKEDPLVDFYVDGKPKRTNYKWRAVKYKCRKCESVILVPAGEDISEIYGAPDCREIVVSEVMET